MSAQRAYRWCDNNWNWGGPRYWQPLVIWVGDKAIYIASDISGSAQDLTRLVSRKLQKFTIGSGLIKLSLEFLGFVIAIFHYRMTKGIVPCVRVEQPLNLEFGIVLVDRSDSYTQVQPLGGPDCPLLSRSHSCIERASSLFTAWNSILTQPEQHKPGTSPRQSMTKKAFHGLANSFLKPSLSLFVSSIEFSFTITLAHWVDSTWIAISWIPYREWTYETNQIFAMTVLVSLQEILGWRDLG